MNLHNKNILLVEDDKHIYELIKAMLKPYKINLVLKNDGLSGLEAALSGEYDIILLDIMLPEKDGWEICREIDNSKVNTPIIILTARVEEADKVLGLELGADDYITKPFSPRELLARIKAVMRRFSKTEKLNNKNELNFPEINLIIDISGHNVFLNKKKLSIPPKEFELIVLLAENEGTTFSRKDLLSKIWGYDSSKTKDSRTIDEHIKRLRKYFSDTGLKDNPLKTVWGIGYKFEIDGENNEA